MVKSRASCVSLPTNKDKCWLYHEYYTGERDEEDRKHGTGENHWTRASCIEWYTGHMVRDTMHGLGDYRWRYNGPDCEFVTHEGQFYANQVHGYGVTSYPDGRVFIGLYHTNVRWGPGVERHANLLANVGFWRADQLVRLAWRPSVPCVAPDLTTGNQGPAFVKPFRMVLAKNDKVIGETNVAIELLKQAGADPRVAAEKWTKLYPKNCTDLKSPMCLVDVWTRDYYHGKIPFLDEKKLSDGTENIEQENPDDDDDTSRNSPVALTENLYAWNNSQMIVEMMKHCYTHEKQRKQVQLNLANILSGTRKRFRPPAEHERDCRTLLMACYLGHIINVAQLVNEHDVDTNIADVQGNTALMYAACGNQEKIIHLLVEAGGDVNYMNDSCCTPLTVALMYYLCTNRDIGPKDMLQFLLPKSVDKTQSTDEKVAEWLINRELNVTHQASNPSNAIRRTSLKKSTKSMSAVQKHATKDEEYDSDDSFHEEKRLYTTIQQEYEIRVHNLFSQRSAAASQYIFDVRNIVDDALLFDATETLTAANAKIKKELSKIMNISKEASMMNNVNSNEKQDTLNSYDKIKQEILAKMMQTILQLLSDGADPRLVKCPKPALFLAVSSGNPDLIRHLVHYGVDINEVYPETLNYTALDIAVALPFTTQNLELVRALLECGADPNHRLQMPADKSEIPGPTLLHAVISRKIESEFEEEVRNQVFQLLLQYNCDPLPTFNGCSAIDNAISKNLDLLDLIIKSPATIDLNAIINDKNQTILVKLFTAAYFVTARCSDRYLTLTNLLLYGADPLIECQNGDSTYGNVYEFAKKTLYEDFGYRTMVSAQTSPTSPDPRQRTKNNDAIQKGKSASKTAQQDKVKPLIKCSDEDIRDYIEALQLMTHCGRMLHVRWIQSKLMRELVDIIQKYKHRHWNVIIKEHKHKECCALWLTTQRCLEMWDIYKQTRRSAYQDKIVLKHLLSIVQFYNTRHSAGKIKYPVTAIEKDAVDSYVSSLSREHRTPKIMEIVEEWKKNYVKPELCSLHDPKFDICFNCALPLKFIEDNTLCSRCKLVWFCSMECMKINVELENNCHPCSGYLMRKHFQNPSPVTDRSVEV